MKRTALILLTAMACQIVLSQEPDTTAVNIGKKNIITVTEDDNKTDVRVLDDDIIVNVDEEDTVKIKIGNRAISISETDTGTNIEIIKMDDFKKHCWEKKKNKFMGHWAGFELGLNDILDKDFNIAGTNTDIRYLDLNTGKSWNVNLNFIQYSLPMSRGSGWVTGLGFEWNNYFFDRNNSIGKDSMGYITPVYPPTGVSYTKSKLNTTYLTLPLLLEFQFGKEKNGFISFGAIGGLKVYSDTKTKYISDGVKEKNRVKGDYNLSPLRYALTIRGGYKFIKFYANYGMVPFFTKNTGPEIHPINVGLILCSFR
jgi:hypothetical protein